MRVTVLIRPKSGILDPQGEAVQGSLHKLGFSVGGARGSSGSIVQREGTVLTRHSIATPGR